MIHTTHVHTCDACGFKDTDREPERNDPRPPAGWTVITAMVQRGPILQPQTHPDLLCVRCSTMHQGWLEAQRARIAGP